MSTTDQRHAALAQVDRAVSAPTRAPHAAADTAAGPSIPRSISSSYANWAVSFLVPLIMLPLFVRFLGAELYGTWVVILSVLTYVGLAELGFWQAFGNRAAEMVAAGRRTEIAHLVSTAFFAYAALAVLLIALFEGAGPALWGRLFGAGAQDSAFTAFAAVFVLSALALPFKTYAMLLRSFERVDREQRIGLWSNLARSVAMALALVAGFQLVAIAAIHGLAILAAGLAAYVASIRITPEARPRLSRFSLATMRTLAKPGIAFWMLGVAYTLTFGLDNLVIGYVLGAEAVTSYAVPLRLVLVPMGIFAVGFASLWPTVTQHYARRNLDVLRRGFNLGLRLAILYGVASAIALWIAGPALIDWWVGPGVFPDRVTFGLQLALLVIQVLLIPADTVLMATSRHYGYAAMAVTEGALNLVLSLWWVHLFGLAGVVAGTVAARLLTNGWYMQLAALRTLEVSLRSEIKRLLVPALVAAAVLVAVAALSDELLQRSAALSLALAVAAASAFALAYVLLGLSREDRAAGVAIIGGLWRTREAA